MFAAESVPVCYKRVNSGTDVRAAQGGVWGGGAGLPCRPPGPMVPTSSSAHKPGSSLPHLFGFLWGFHDKDMIHESVAIGD